MIDARCESTATHSDQFTKSKYPAINERRMYWAFTDLQNRLELTHAGKAPFATVHRINRWMIRSVLFRGWSAKKSFLLFIKYLEFTFEYHFELPTRFSIFRRQVVYRTPHKWWATMQLQATHWRVRDNRRLVQRVLRKGATLRYIHVDWRLSIAWTYEGWCLVILIIVEYWGKVSRETYIQIAQTTNRSFELVLFKRGEGWNSPTLTCN